MAKKSGTSKVLIGCGIVTLLAILAIAGCGWWFWSKVNLDPVEIKNLAETEIVQGSTVPPSLVGFMALDIGELQMAMFRSVGTDPAEMDTGHVLVLASGPEDERAEMETQVRDKTNQQTGGGESEDLGTETFQVGGEDVEFKKSRRVQKGTATLQYIGVLPERNGRATVVMFVGPEEGFDRETLTGFLASIPAAGGA